MKKLKIAVTGGIGSGKSSALTIIKEMGYPAYSCDEIYSQLLSEREFVEKIGSFFSGVVSGGILDRKALASIIFSDEKKKLLLNSITHPEIMKRMIFYMEKDEGQLSFGEVPLLFEGRFEHLFDHVFIIFREREERIKAVMKRNSISRDEVESRINAQADYNAIKREMSNNKSHFHYTIINNDSSLEELEMGVKRAIEIVKGNML